MEICWTDLICNGENRTQFEYWISVRQIYTCIAKWFVFYQNNSGITILNQNTWWIQCNFYNVIITTREIFDEIILVLYIFVDQTSISILLWVRQITAPVKYTMCWIQLQICFRFTVVLIKLRIIQFIDAFTCENLWNGCNLIGLLIRAFHRIKHSAKPISNIEMIHRHIIHMKLNLKWSINNNALINWIEMVIVINQRIQQNY